MVATESHPVAQRGPPLCVKFDARGYWDMAGDLLAQARQFRSERGRQPAADHHDFRVQHRGDTGDPKSESFYERVHNATRDRVTTVGGTEDSGWADVTAAGSGEDGLAFTFGGLLRPRAQSVGPD